MRVYLVRHAKASKDPDIPTDAERPLTRRGRKDAEQIARLMAHSAPALHQIRHSGLVRARETAEIFAGVLGTPPGGVIPVKGLHYADPVEPLARELPLEPESIMLVGHNPFMENLVSVMLTGSVGRTPLYFTTTTVACMEYMHHAWTLRWALSREFTGEPEID